MFQSPPSEEESERLLGVLERWTELVLLGAYPESGMDPRESGCIPEPPCLLDGFTVEASFPEAFVADDAAFFTIVNHAALLHRAGQAISAVIVR